MIGSRSQFLQYTRNVFNAHSILFTPFANRFFIRTEVRALLFAHSLFRCFNRINQLQIKCFHTCFHTDEANCWFQLIFLPFIVIYKGVSGVSMHNCKLLLFGKELLKWNGLNKTASVAHIPVCHPFYWPTTKACSWRQQNWWQGSRKSNYYLWTVDRRFHLRCTAIAMRFEFNFDY